MDLVWCRSWLEWNWKVLSGLIRAFAGFSPLPPSFTLFLLQTLTQQLQFGTCQKNIFFLVDWRFYSRLESLPCSPVEKTSVCEFVCVRVGGWVGVCMCMFVWMNKLQVCVHLLFRAARGSVASLASNLTPSSHKHTNKPPHTHTTHAQVDTHRQICVWI